MFVVVPMLNPDGVYRGHARMDTQGNDLNRCYHIATLKDQPTIYAMKALFRSLKKRLFLFCDFHSHPNREGIFVFGTDNKIEHKLFGRVMAMNHEHFDYDQCVFESRKEKTVKKGIAS